MSDFNLGTVTAYGYAKDKGYTGTEDEFAALMASYADVAEQAAESATQAAASATTASTKASEAAASATAAASSKTAAETAQSGAETAAQTATTKAGEASASATTASGKATEATTAAGTATTKASEATTAATTATTKAGEASTSATNAAASATRAQEILDSIPEDYSQMSEDVSDLKDGLNGISIEGYEKDTSVSGTVHENTLVSVAGNLVTSSAWYCEEIECEEGETYRITGTGNPLYITETETGVVNSQYSPGSFVNVSDYLVTIPEGATKLFVNRKNAQPLIDRFGSVKYVKDKNSIAKLVADKTYDIIGTEYTQTVQLNGSRNGAFNFYELKRNGETFKVVADDISPVLTDVGYIGANHGYNYSYLCTANGHGLTAQDIGYSFESGGNAFVLLRIDSENQFTVGCYDGGVWFRMKNVQPPVSMTFNSKAVTTTTRTLQQLRPAIKNVSCEVITDGDSRFTVEETYDIIDIGVGIDAIIANKGNNDNESFVTFSDPLMTIRNIYEFDDLGNAVIYANLKVNKDSVRLDQFFGTQVAGFDGNTDCIAVSGTTYNTLTAATPSFYSGVWEDVDVAPSLFFKSDAAKAKGMVIYYGIDRLTDIGNYAGTVNGTSGKLYPNLCNVRTSGLANKVYGNYMLRMPVEADENGDFSKIVKVNNSLFVFVYLASAKTANFSIPLEFNGSIATEVVTDGCKCLSKMVVGKVDVQSTDAGMILIRLDRV